MGIGIMGLIIHGITAAIIYTLVFILHSIQVIWYYLMDKDKTTLYKFLVAMDILKSRDKEKEVFQFLFIVLLICTFGSMLWPLADIVLIYYWFKFGLKYLRTKVRNSKGWKNIKESEKHIPVKLKC